MIDRLTLSGTLSHSPELTLTATGMPICRLQLVVNERVKDRQTGAWSKRSRCFAIDVCGATGERCSHRLHPGDEVTIVGRPQWQTGPANDSDKRLARALIAEQVQCNLDYGGGGSQWSLALLADTSAVAGNVASDSAF